MHRGRAPPAIQGGDHRFPGATHVPRSVVDQVGEVVELLHSPIHTAPLARIKFDDGLTCLVVATEGVSVGADLRGIQCRLATRQHHPIGQHP